MTKSLHIFQAYPFTYHLEFLKTKQVNKWSSLGFSTLMIRSQLQRPSAWSGDGWSASPTDQSCSLSTFAIINVCLQLIYSYQSSSCHMFSIWITGCSFTLHAARFAHIPCWYLTDWKSVQQMQLLMSWNKVMQSSEAGRHIMAHLVTQIQPILLAIIMSVKFYTCLNWLNSQVGWISHNKTYYPTF